MKVESLVTHIVFDSDSALPPGLIITVDTDFGKLGVKVLSVQKSITPNTYTITGRLVNLSAKSYLYGEARDKVFHDEIKAMEIKQIKEVLAGQGLSKQEVEIVLGAIKGVKITPLAYSELNASTDEIIELREYKEKAQGAIAILGGATEPKKERKPRSDKGTVKSQVEPVMKVTPDPEPVKVEPVKTEAPATGKKAPTPRKVKASDADKKGKESAEDIKANVANLGGGPQDDNEIPL